jgi:5-methylcytosine-specific restriction endonuclease McrA
MQKHPLLTRDRFRESVLARDNHACVVCKRKGIPLDAHHIIERRLFPDGGYYHAYPVGWYESRAPDRQLPFRTHGYVSAPGSAL